MSFDKYILPCNPKLYLKHDHYHQPKKFSYASSQSISTSLDVTTILIFSTIGHFVFYRIAYEWNHTICIPLLCLIYFFKYNLFDIHPCCPYQ